MKEEFAGYKSDIDDTNEKTLLELTQMQRLFSEVSEEKEMQTKKRQDSDRKLLALQTKHEDEVRLRLDIEIKINKLQNYTRVITKHEVTLNRRIEELEIIVAEYKSRCLDQEKEIVLLRSYKLQSEMTKQLNEVKIISVQQNEMETKEKLISVTMNMQQKDSDLANKTNMTMQLQSVLDTKDSRIRVLNDIVS